jgi:uncharacterized protein
VIRHDLSPAEVRVLGCLIEKQRTTPDGYPLTRNAVRLACNQSTNREPVVDFDETTVRAALERLGRNGLVRFTSAQGSRAAKYRHLAGDQMGIGDAELALLALLMLRGPQTPGELRGRSERLHRFGEMGEVEEALLRLIDVGLVLRFERRPGQKEQRFGHLLSSSLEDIDEDPGELPAIPAVLAQDPAGGDPADPHGAPGPQEHAAAAPPSDPSDPRPALEERVSALEADLRALRRQLADLLED